MPSSYASLTRSLLQGFSRRKPVRAGSLLVTILGDAIVPRGGTVSLASLITLGTRFGLSERLVRTSIGRLAQEDWVRGRRVGRNSEYSLSKSGRQRFAEATRKIYREDGVSWSNRWTLALLPPAPAAARAAARDALFWHGFGQLEPGLLAHPTATVEQVHSALEGLPMSRAVIVLQATGHGQGTDPRLARTGWDLDRLARQYRGFVRRFGGVERMQKPPSMADSEAAFVIRTLLIHEYRRIHLHDPTLPRELLPTPWIGRTAYELCGSLYCRLLPASESFLDHAACRLDGPLPPLDREARARFGGLPG